MDLGYIFGNEAGDSALARAYWFNRSWLSRMVQDAPDESRIEPSQWGVATIE